MYPIISTYINNLTKEFNSIPKQRRSLLETIAQYIRKKQVLNKPINLIYICTHNSRRSHFGQVWAKVAANFYGIKNINSFSGGTQKTAFNINAINALVRIGFKIQQQENNENNIFNVFYDDFEAPCVCYSKVYDDLNNPQYDFAAILTCSDAEQNCPFSPEVELRVSTTYDDPKEYDNTVLQDIKYDERCKQIALETLYVFSQVNN